MFEYIRSNKQSKPIKVKSAAGKRLLKDYAEKYEKVVNPVTNKVVQSRGRVGQCVLGSRVPFKSPPGPPL